MIKKGQSETHLFPGLLRLKCVILKAHSLLRKGYYLIHGCLFLARVRHRWFKDQ